MTGYLPPASEFRRAHCSRCISQVVEPKIMLRRLADFASMQGFSWTTVSDGRSVAVTLGAKDFWFFYILHTSSCTSSALFWPRFFASPSTGFLGVTRKSRRAGEKGQIVPPNVMYVSRCRTYLETYREGSGIQAGSDNHRPRSYWRSLTIMDLVW